MNPPPEGFNEWMGYLLFHPWAELSTMGMSGLLLLGMVVGRWVERRQRKASTDADRR